MKRRALIGHLKKHGCDLIREGGNHSWRGNAARAGFTRDGIRSTFIPTAQVNTRKAVSGALSRTLSKVLAAPVG